MLGFRVKGYGYCVSKVEPPVLLIRNCVIALQFLQRSVDVVTLFKVYVHFLRKYDNDHIRWLCWYCE